MNKDDNQLYILMYLGDMLKLNFYKFRASISYLVLFHRKMNFFFGIKHQYIS